MCGNLISDCGSKYHKTTKFVRGTFKKIIPSRPVLNSYDSYYRRKYPIEDPKFSDYLIYKPDIFDAPWGKKGLELVAESDLLAVDCIYYKGVQQ